MQNVSGNFTTGKKTPTQFTDVFFHKDMSYLQGNKFQIDIPLYATLFSSDESCRQLLSTDASKNAFVSF